MKKKRKKKNIFLMLIGIILVIAAVVGVVPIVTKSLKDDGLKSIYPMFTRGELTITGKYSESKVKLYTEQAFECQGLVVEPDFNTSYTYQVYFYRDNDVFIRATDVYDCYVDIDVPFEATTARIVITPELEEKEELGFFSGIEYSSKINVKVNKEQYSIEEKYPESDLAFGCSERVELLKENCDLVVDHLSEFYVPAPIDTFEDKMLTRIDVPITYFPASETELYFNIFIINKAKNTGKYFINATYEIKIAREDLKSSNAYQWLSVDLTEYNIFIEDGQALGLGNGNVSCLLNDGINSAGFYRAENFEDEYILTSDNDEGPNYGFVVRIYAKDIY